MFMKYDRLKSGVITTYITYLVQFLCFFFLTPVFIRLLGQSNYGVYQIALSIVSYIAIINFGIPHSYMRFFATEKAKGNRNGIKSLNGFYFLGMLFFSLLVLVWVLLQLYVLIKLFRYFDL
jgi:O-antigen/teichoic acid export membrane protein